MGVTGVDTAGAETPELTGLTKAGLWYIYSSTPTFWVWVARGFGLKVEPSDWADETLRRAERDAADAVRFVPVPLVVTAVMIGFSSWWRPAFGDFLTSVVDEGYVPLVRSAPLHALGHDSSQIGAIVLLVFAVWVLSMATVLVSFAPIWLAFRHQMRVAAPIVAVALAADADMATAAASDALDPYPRIRYSFGKLKSGWRRRREARHPTERETGGGRVS